ncbi:efflux RND transporter periplasmic adaptor subunit [Persephonella sp.]
MKKLSVFTAGLFSGIAVCILLVFVLFITGKVETYKDVKSPVQSDKLPKPSPVSKDSITQMLNIDTVQVRKMFLEKTVKAYGELEHPENDLKDITFKISGYVEELYADFTGKYVRKGEPLLSIYSPQLVSAQEEFIRAYQYYKSMENSDNAVLKESARQLYEAAYKRLKYWDIPEKQIEELKNSQKITKTITLHSPYDGWVMEKYVNLGSKVEEGKPVMRIAKHHKLWLIAHVYEQDIPFIKEGQNVKVRFISHINHQMEGKIDYIYPMMDSENRTLKVRIVIDNSHRKFFPGMYGSVEIKVPVGESLVLPETAVFNTGKRQVVFVQTGQGVFEPVFVKLGIYADGYYQIKEGLHEGMTAANSALFLLDADAQLKGKYSKDKKETKMMHHHH